MDNTGIFFGQHNHRVAKININLGESNDLIVYNGYGICEINNLAGKDDAIVVAGHFRGYLTTLLFGDTPNTIWYSNIKKGGIPNQVAQFY